MGLFWQHNLANAIGGTFAKPHKPTLKPSFAEEPPSQRTKTDTKWQRTNTTEKKGEVLTSVLQNGGLSASMTVYWKVQVQFFKSIFVLKIRHFAKLQTVRSERIKFLAKLSFGRNGGKVLPSEALRNVAGSWNGQWSPKVYFAWRKFNCEWKTKLKFPKNEM